MIRTFNAKRTRTVVAGFVGAVLFCGVSASASATGTGRHVIKVDTSPYAKQTWSVYADLYNGKGQRVHHWQETSKKGGKGYVRWEYTDGSDGGWLHVWVDPSSAQRASFLNLPLNKNHCYHITAPVLGPFSEVVEVKNCPF